MNSGIYLIKNLKTGKVYIGSAVNLDRRLYFHKWALERGRHGNIYLQRAWDKNSSDCFVFEIFLFCETKDLIEYEQSIIDAFVELNGWVNIYNLSPTAGSSLGRKLSEETKRKIGLKSKGRWTGKFHTEETKQKMSKVQMGRTITAKHRKNISKGRTGIKVKPFTEEHKRKIGEANKRYFARKKELAI